MSAITNLITNSSNIIRFLKEFSVDSAKDVSVSIINADGSESKRTFPNVAKQIAGLESWKNNTTINLDSEYQSLTGNLIKDSYVTEVTDEGKPVNVFSRGEVEVTAVHPYTEGFESPYISEKCDDCIDTPHGATSEHPYYKAKYDKGSRISRGGLNGGWNGISGGHIIKITKVKDSEGSWASIGFTPTKLALVHKIRFRGYIKIIKGSQVGFGSTSGYNGSIRGHSISKTDTDKAPDGWMKLDFTVGTDSVTNPFSLNFLMGMKLDEEYEVYLALPSASIVPSSSYRLQTVQEV